MIVIHKFINCPSDTKVALLAYLSFLVEVIEAEGLKFPIVKPEPVFLARQYLSGKVLESEYENAAVSWWEFLEDEYSLTDFKSREALLARVALCLIGVRLREVDELNDHLEWFFEVLEKLGGDLEGAENIALKHFEFLDEP